MLRTTLALMCLPALVLAATFAFANDALRDPTKPLNYKASQAVATKPATKFAVDSILISAKRKHAVINGLRVMVGQVVDGMRVTQIEPDSVVLTNAERTLRIPLTHAGVKKSRRPSGLAMRTTK